MIRKLWRRVVAWWTVSTPAVGTSKPEKHKPVRVPVEFYLHADGKVYRVPRDGAGVRRIDSPDVREVVYDEFRVLASLARRRLRWRRLIRRV